MNQIIRIRILLLTNQITLFFFSKAYRKDKQNKANNKQNYGCSLKFCQHTIITLNEMPVVIVVSFNSL